MIVSVRLTPKSSADRIDEAVCTTDGKWELKARVRAVPEDGKANAALLKLVAESLKLRKADVSLAGGGKSRDKRVMIEGQEAEIHESLARLAAACSVAGG